MMSITTDYENAQGKLHDNGSTPVYNYRDDESAVEAQPDPQDGREVVLFHVLDDLKKRAAKGQSEYGTLLKTHNGRLPLIDAYQEALDLSMYLKQAILEQSKFQQLVTAELSTARATHPAVDSLHHYHSVLLEELNEFSAEVAKKPGLRCKANLLEELIQIAAMAQRCAEDLRLI